MKRVMIACTLLLVASMFIAGASKSIAQPQTFTFKAATPFAKGQTDVQILDWWADQLNKRTQGRVKATVFYAGALGTGLELPQNVEQGIVDVAFTAPEYTSLRFPVITSLGAFTFRVHSPVAAGHIVYSLHNKGFTDKELASYKVMWFHPVAPLNFLTKRSVEKLEDLKGRKIRASSAEDAKKIRILGGEPILLPPGELYQSLERGIIEGSLGGSSLIPSLKLHEVAKFFLAEPVSGATLFSVMNRNKWNSLPQDLQFIISELNQETFWVAMDNSSKFLQGISQQLVKFGVKEQRLSAAERERWKKTTAELPVAHFKELKSKGLPADEMWDIIQNALWHWGEKE